MPEFSSEMLKIAAIIVLILLIFFVIALFAQLHSLKYKCPKCKRRTEVEQLHEDDLGVAVPGHVRIVLECKHCGFVWMVVEDRREDD